MLAYKYNRDPFASNSPSSNSIVCCLRSLNHLKIDQQAISYLMASSLENIREAQRASGTATILAIGTATPPNVFEQADYPDFYFRVTKSEHKTDLKEKLQRICKHINIH